MHDADEAALMRCHCLAHGRRKFSELEETFPAECTVVIEAFKQVFEHDGYPFNAGQLEYECHYSKMHGMPVTGGRGFRALKPLWYHGVPP